MRVNTLRTTAIQVSDAALVEALPKLSPDALRLVMGMLVHMSQRPPKSEATFDAAARIAGMPCLFSRTIDELIAHGLLRQNDAGTSYILHDLIAQVGGTLAMQGQRSDLFGGGRVLAVQPGAG